MKTKSKLTQEEILQRLQMASAADELEKVKKDMNNSPRTFAEMGPGVVPLENLSGIGQSEDQIYSEICKLLSDFLNKLGDMAFSLEKKEQFFPKSKIVHLVKIMKSANMEMEARSIMDIFKDRVKQKNEGKMPTIKEKVGMFGKTTERIMKLEEIASHFPIEDDLPPGDVKPLGAHGTKNGILMHLSNILLQSEGVLDPLKKGARKTVGLFLKAAGLINTAAQNPQEKYFLACLFTPDSIQPKSRNDKDGLAKFRTVLKKGVQFLEERMEAKKNKSSPQPVKK